VGSFCGPDRRIFGDALRLQLQVTLTVRPSRTHADRGRWAPPACADLRVRGQEPTVRTDVDGERDRPALRGVERLVADGHVLQVVEHAEVRTGLERNGAYAEAKLSTLSVAPSSGP
jgi:hypothetical protein